MASNFHSVSDQVKKMLSALAQKEKDLESKLREVQVKEVKLGDERYCQGGR